MATAPKTQSKKPADPFQRVTQPGTERVLCFNEADGKLLWKHEYDCPYTVSYAAGPRAMPTIDGDRVYTLHWPWPPSGSDGRVQDR